jgi:PAS domain S-box-containing protein
MPELWQSFLQTSQDWIWAMDASGRHTYSNPAVEQILGFPPAEIIGGQWTDLAHPEETKRLQEMVSDLTGQRRGWNGLLIRFRHRHGGYRYLESCGVPLLDANGNLRGYQGVDRDVTHRIRAEETVRHREALFRTVVNHTPVVTFAMDAEGIFTLSEGLGLTKLGYQPGEVVGRSAFEVYQNHPLICTAIRRALQGEKGRFDINVNGLTFDAVFNPTLNERGEVTGLIGVATDVTERKQAEQSLQASEERFRAIMEQTADIISLLDANGVLLYNSPAALRIHGYSTEDLLHRNTFNLIHPDDQAAVAAKYQELLEHPERSISTIYRYRNRDGCYTWMEASARNLIDNPFIQGIVAVSRDVTERKQAEDELRELSLQLMRSQDDERRRIARELHDATAQGLVALKISLGMLRKRSAKWCKASRANLEESFALADQSVNEVRTLSYLLHPPQLEQLGLVGAIHNFAEGFGLRAGLQVHTELCPQADQLSEEYQFTLFRVLQESLANVLRHSGSKTVVIKLNTSEAACELRVIDTGKGMLTSSPGGNLGVGIPGMRERLRNLGGRLEIRSSPEGTTIMAMLPFQRRKTCPCGQSAQRSDCQPEPNRAC